MTNQYFADPPRGVIEVFSTVFIIAKEHWKTLGLIAIFQLLSMIAAILVLSLVTALTSATYVMSLVNTIKSLGGDMNGDYGNGLSRTLFDYSTGIHGASRLLQYEDYDGFDFDNMDDGFATLFSAKTVMVLLSIYFLWVLVLSLVTSVYVGTYFHTLGNIYTGGFPSVRESMSRGMSQMWSVYFFSLMYSLIVTLFFLLMVALPFKMNWPEFQNVGMIGLGVILFIISMVLLGSLMAAATPSIVVERKSAIQAFGRSMDLCKSFICFIFCTQFSYVVTLIVVSLIFNMMFNHLPGALAFIGHLFVNLLSSAIMPV